jgi:Ca-activated chloride channel homolog
MRFAQPLYLYLLLLVPALVAFWVLVDQRRRKLLARFGSISLIEKVGLSVSRRARWVKRSLMLFGILLVVVSLARPQWGAKISRIEQKGVDIVIAIDTSKSMLATDIKPSRLEKAKYELEKLIDILMGDRIGIVCFAGTAFNLSPLTLDYAAARLFLQSISTDIVPVAGTNLAEAIKAATENFNTNERKYKVILLLTDGEDHGKDAGMDPMKAAEEAKKQGAVIYTIGIGSSEGSPIPMEEEGGLQYKRDQSGEMIMSRLDEDTLKQIALATGGKYYHSTAGELEVEKIYNEIKQMEKKKFGEQVQIEYEDRFQYFLAAAMALLFVSVLVPERKR